MSIRPNRSTATAWRQHWRRTQSPEPYDAPAPRLAVRLALVPPQPEASPFVPRERRHGGPSQDEALYSCGCGFRFEAPVSTSVGCPRCGGTQAW